MILEDADLPNFNKNGIDSESIKVELEIIEGVLQIKPQDAKVIFP